MKSLTTSWAICTSVSQAWKQTRFASGNAVRRAPEGTYLNPELSAANLRSADGQSMRCRFDLIVPSQGMGGGGQGRCQLDNGGSIDASFPRT